MRYVIALVAGVVLAAAIAYSKRSAQPMVAEAQKPVGVTA